ncbi:MAG: hypothetical protein SGJ23_14930 [Alphaproteobacteria bacterium]|nr:hypothetical protein [Alphaproteobacteria bacterium]
MQIHRANIPHHFIADALADFRLWFFDLLVWVATFVTLPRSLRLFMQQETRTARRELRHLLAYATLADQTFKETPRRTWRPRALAHGFRFQYRKIQLRKIWTRGVRLRTRDDIRHILENFDKIVTRLRARFHQRIRIGDVMMVCAPCVTFITSAPAPAAEVADTS